MDNLAFIGIWEVIDCEYLKGRYIGNDKYITCMEGIRFRLDENGDITWTVPEELKSVPLFSCETYELFVHSGKGVILRLGAYAGHVFEFASDRGVPKESLTLTCEGLCTLHCERITDETPDVNANNPFTLLPALEDGYFSDITITASNKKQFKVHSTILELQGDDIDWTADPPPFSNIPEDVLGTILHFFYSECLPENLNEETAHQVIIVATPYASLNKLVNNCQLYLKNMALKQQIIGLVNDMHSSMNQIIDRFHIKTTHSSSLESIGANPAKLCFIVKQTIRDAAVAGVKLLLLCDLFTKRKNELTRNERHEIIRYAKSRLPIFLTQLTRFLQALKNTFSSMSSAQRVEIATFLVPEIEVILDTISMLIEHVEKALQQIIQGLFTPDVGRPKNVGDMLSKTLRNLLHIRELTKLNTLHNHITCSLALLVHKKENFNQMTSSQKVRSIARNLEQLIEELPIFLLRLEETASVFDEKLEWRDFKFCFKVGTSKVSDILNKLLARTDSLQDVMLQVCELVQRDAFTQTLQCLGLLNTAASTSHSNDTPKMTRSTSYSTPKHHGYKLNLVGSLCKPPLASNSLLSKQCLKLLNNEKKADMEFEVIERVEEDAPPSPLVEKCIIKSHRVIVAARCDWFRRALLSGMREAIDKKIIIHDTYSFIFKVFLEYLYSGKLNRDVLCSVQVIEVLLLSDRYEMDCLKQTCQQALIPDIDIDNVLMFLSVADQYNASLLKSCCLNFISKHHELTDSEEFFELPISLQADIFDSVWTQPSGRQSDALGYSMEHLLPTSSTSSNSIHNSTGVSGILEAAESALLTPEIDSNHSNNSSLEDLHLEEHSTRMSASISQMRDIVGESASRETLVQVILAADFDLRRAVNYYYARNNDKE